MVREPRRTGLRNPDLGEEFVGGDHGFEVAGEKVGGRDHSFAARTPDDEVRVEREEHGREVACRVAVRH